MDDQQSLKLLNRLARRDSLAHAYHVHLTLTNGQKLSGPVSLPRSPPGSLRIFPDQNDLRGLDVPLLAITAAKIEDLP